jgi:PiT family inorganic phosphate transporter
MLPLALLALAALFLAYSNGANDNFKGVATLFGSRTTSYRSAILWATVTTLTGSVCSVFLARGLVSAFSGHGLVPDAVAGTPSFALAVALGAGFTVMLATLTGFPISTTHALTGALAGAGLAAVGWQVHFSHLGQSFFLPLIASPVLSIAVAAPLYVVFRALRIRSGITKEWCICAGERELAVPISQPESALSFARITAPDITLAPGEACVQRYRGKALGIGVQEALDAGHFLSAGAVSFARGLNDTPKIVALLLGLEALGVSGGMLAVAVAMAAGGLLSARRVARTMSERITPLNHGQGFTANIVTAALVIGASRLGLPVSTTHVAVGSLSGVGLVTGGANRRVLGQILMSWILTLPIAALLGACLFALTTTT